MFPMHRSNREHSVTLSGVSDVDKFGRFEAEFEAMKAGREMFGARE
jgi:hypothetical protein